MRTDRHDEVNSRFSQSCGHAYKSSMGTAYFLRFKKSVQTTIEADTHLADGEYLHEEIKLNVAAGRTKFKVNIIIIIIIIIIIQYTLFKLSNAVT